MVINTARRANTSQTRDVPYITHPSQISRDEAQPQRCHLLRLRDGRPRRTDRGLCQNMHHLSKNAACLIHALERIRTLNDAGVGRVEAHNTAADMPSVSLASSPGATLTYARQDCAPNSMSTAATLPHKSIYVMQARRLRKKRYWTHRRYKTVVQKRKRSRGVDAASRRREWRRLVTQNPTNSSGAFSTPFKPYNTRYI